MATIPLLWAELSSIPDDGTACFSPPCETVAADAPSHDPDTSNRAAKHGTRDRIATGCCVLVEEAPGANPLDTRFSGEAITSPCVAEATAPLSSVKVQSFAPQLNT